MIETPRLTLRLHTLKDAPALLELNRDPEVVRFTGDALILNLKEAENLIRGKLSRYAVFLKDGNYIGWCGLRHLENNEVDLGYRFMKKYWGQGYATEAAKACLEYGFKELKLKRIIARARPDNRPSLKVIQKLRMNFRGCTSDMSDNNTYIVYDITDTEYEACED